MGRDATVMRSLMPHRVIVEACSTTNNYGEVTYQTCVTYRAAIQGPTKFLHQETQQERVSKHTVYIGTTGVITTKDRITLPSEFEVTQGPILDVSRVSDDKGLHHVKVQLG